MLVFNLLLFSYLIEFMSFIAIAQSILLISLQLLPILADLILYIL